MLHFCSILSPSLCALEGVDERWNICWSNIRQKRRIPIFGERDWEVMGDVRKAWGNPFRKNTDRRKKFLIWSYLTIYWIQVSLFIRGRYVLSFWTVNLEFVDEKSIFDWKIVVLDHFWQCEWVNSQIKSLEKISIIMLC